MIQRLSASRWVIFFSLMFILSLVTVFQNCAQKAFEVQESKLTDQLHHSSFNSNFKTSAKSCNLYQIKDTNKKQFCNCSESDFKFAKEKQIVGNLLYEADTTDICAAAVHAGIVSDFKPATIYFKKGVDCNKYVSTKLNGIESDSYNSKNLTTSFYFRSRDNICGNENKYSNSSSPEGSSNNNGGPSGGNSIDCSQVSNSNVSSVAAECLDPQCNSKWHGQILKNSNVITSASMCTQGQPIYNQVIEELNGWAWGCKLNDGKKEKIIYCRAQKEGLQHNENQMPSQQLANSFFAEGWITSEPKHNQKNIPVEISRVNFQFDKNYKLVDSSKILLRLFDNNTFTVKTTLGLKLIGANYGSKFVFSIDKGVISKATLYGTNARVFFLEGAFEDSTGKKFLGSDKIPVLKFYFQKNPQQEPESFSIARCGSAFGGTYKSKPTEGLCDGGTVKNFVSSNILGEYTWSCQGQSSSENCTAYMTQNGKCLIPSIMNNDPLDLNQMSLCETGNINSTSFKADSSKAIWICDGLNGGSSVNCEKVFGQSVQCGRSSLLTFESKPTSQLCAEGFTSSTVIENANKTLFSWTCSRPGVSGSQVNCSAKKGSVPRCTDSVESSYESNSFPGQFCEVGRVSSAGVTTDPDVFRWVCEGTNNTMVQACTIERKQDAICGEKNGQTLKSLPADQLCFKGVLNSKGVQTDTTQFKYSWVCDGVKKGKSVNCSALMSNDGDCGIATTVRHDAQPAVNTLCNMGTPSSVTMDESKQNFYWSCNGINKGTIKNCSAKILKASCGVAHGTTMLNAPSGADLCASGTPSISVNVDSDKKNFIWTCKVNFTQEVLNCSARIEDSTCGSSHGLSLLRESPASSTLCKKGAASNVTTSSDNLSYNWTCAVQGVSAPVKCQAGKFNSLDVACADTTPSKSGARMICFDGYKFYGWNKTQKSNGGYNGYNLTQEDIRVLDQAVPGSEKSIRVGVKNIYVSYDSGWVSNDEAIIIKYGNGSWKITINKGDYKRTVNSNVNLKPN